MFTVLQMAVGSNDSTFHVPPHHRRIILALHQSVTVYLCCRFSVLTILMLYMLLPNGQIMPSKLNFLTQNWDILYSCAVRPYGNGVVHVNKVIMR